jgi:hypothetical protein
MAAIQFIKSRYSDRFCVNNFTFRSPNFSKCSFTAAHSCQLPAADASSGKTNSTFTRNPKHRTSALIVLSVTLQSKLINFASSYPNTGRICRQIACALPMPGHAWSATGTLTGSWNFQEEHITTRGVY